MGFDRARRDPRSERGGAAVGARVGARRDRSDGSDRVRVVAPSARLGEVSAFFGDSYRSISEIDLVTFGLGIALGLLAGEIPIPLPSGGTFALGSAGGPLLVALVLGRLGRTGPLVWSLPYSANLTLRQLGLVMFLAGVGLRVGGTLIETLGAGGTATLMLAAALVTFGVASSLIVVGHAVFRMPLGTLLGLVAGAHTQPAALAFAAELTGDDAPNIGYATVFPVAAVSKIVLAHAVIAALGGVGAGA